MIYRHRGDGFVLEGTNTHAVRTESLRVARLRRSEWLGPVEEVLVDPGWPASALGGR